MYVTISVLILIVSFLMMLVVLVQNSKGGGLASNFSSHNQILGVRKTTDFLEKTTWTLAVLLVVFCLTASVTSKNSDPSDDIQSRAKIEQKVADNPESNEGVLDLQGNADDAKDAE